MSFMKKVVESDLNNGCTGFTLLTRSWWWELTLECGHIEERYVPSHLAKTEKAIAPKKVKCGYCISEFNRKHNIKQ